MTPTASCDVCRKQFSSDELVTISGKTVCARCKPDLVMNVKSGVTASSRIDPHRAEEIRRKISRLNILSFVFAVPGLLMQFSPLLAAGGGLSRETATALVLLRLVGVPLIIVGLICYSLMKGRSGLFGLLGFLSCLGLLILHFVPKKCHNCGMSGSYASKNCGACSAPM